MYLRSILLSFCKPQYHNTWTKSIPTSLQNRQISYSLGLPLKHFFNRVNSLQCVCVSNFIFQQFDFKHTNPLIKDEVQTLFDRILSKNSEDYESERIEELKKVLTFLLSKGYSDKEILEKISIHLKLRYWSYDKFCLLDYIHSDIVLLLPLLTLPLSVLKTVVLKVKSDKSSIKDFSNRIHYLSHHLELEPGELIPILAKHLPLLTMSFKRLEVKMNILKNANINPKYIVKDLWIFNYNELLLANRVQSALKAEVELKPWMLRCSDKFFESLLVKHSETKRILKGENLHCYLAQKLDCSTEYVDYMMEKNKLLKSINIPKLEMVIHFLFKKGYTPEEVRLFPQVFSSSVQTLEKRLDEWRHVKNTLPTLGQLCISNSKFQARLKRLA